MKKTGKPFKWLALIIPVNVLLALYLLMTFYYNDTFWIGTWINGVYCTGKSVKEVSELLQEQTVLEDVLVIDLHGNEEKISMQEVEYQVDYTANLQKLLQKQNPFLWLKGMVSSQGIQVAPFITYDEESLQNQISKLAIVQAAKNPEPAKVEICRTEAGYILEENLSDVPNAEKIMETLTVELQAGHVEIRLTEDCYEDRTPTAAMQETFALWEQVETLQDCGIVYDMGDARVAIDAAQVADWIAIDESGNIRTDETGQILLKEDCFENFIKALAEEYDTYNVPREFLSTRGDIVTIEKGTYGNRLDRKAEIAYLEEAFTNKIREVHIPVYSQEALYKGKDDIGDTYIEVDLTEQMMYYYEDGEIVVETPIVSGNVSAGHKTPARVCYVYNKQTDRILRGPDYASPVDYWMPVIGAIGIHDATWRNKFGGEIYKTNGSHGCINTPYEAMETLYEKVEIGTPVIMFY